LLDRIYGIDRIFCFLKAHFKGPFSILLDRINRIVRIFCLSAFPDERQKMQSAFGGGSTCLLFCGYNAPTKDTVLHLVFPADLLKNKMKRG
jgi:hypothetical protein